MSKWQKVRLKEVLKHRKGTILISDNAEYKLCRVQLHRRGVLLRGKQFGYEIKTKKQQVCRTGDLVVAEMDAKFGGYGFIPKELEGAIVSSHYYLYELDRNKIAQGYFQTLINTDYIQNQIEAKGSTNYSSIRAWEFLEYEIPLPDLDQQTRISEQFFKYLSFKDSLNSEHEKQSGYLIRLRQAILQEAIEGKLTVDWRIENPVHKGDPNTAAAALLQKIKAEKQKLIAEGKIKKEKPLAPIKPEEMPFGLPEGWVWCRIDYLVPSLHRDLRTGPFGSSLHKSDHRQSGVPVLGIESIGKNGVYTGINKIYVDEKKAADLSSFEVKNGDIIISRSGTVGELCRLPDEFEYGLISTNLMKISLNKTIILPTFFCLLFKGAKSIEQQLFTLCSGTSRLFLTQSILSKLSFPLPPLAEQTAIVNRVDRLLAMVDELEKQVSERKVQAEELMQVVLREAFEGKSG